MKKRKDIQAISKQIIRNGENKKSFINGMKK